MIVSYTASTYAYVSGLSLSRGRQLRAILIIGFYLGHIRTSYLLICVQDDLCSTRGRQLRSTSVIGIYLSHILLAHLLVGGSSYTRRLERESIWVTGIHFGHLWLAHFLICSVGDRSLWRGRKLRSVPVIGVPLGHMRLAHLLPLAVWASQGDVNLNGSISVFGIYLHHPQLAHLLTLAIWVLKGATSLSRPTRMSSKLESQNVWCNQRALSWSWTTQNARTLMLLGGSWLIHLVIGFYLGQIRQAFFFMKAIWVSQGHVNVGLEFVLPICA